MLTNPWVIRIGGGVISGIIVYIISNLLVSKKEKNFYVRKLNSANREILQTIRPMIAKDNLFDINLFKSIISSTANKYDVDKTDLYNIQSLIDDIITDIMQSPFLTIEQKDEYCKNLMNLKEKNSKKTNDDMEKIIVKREGISPEHISLLMALMTTLFTIFSIYVYQLNDLEKGLLFSNRLQYFAILIILPLIPLFLIQILDYIKKIKTRSKYTNTKEKQEDEITEKEDKKSKEDTESES